MKRGVAFIHGIGMFGYNMVTKEEILRYLEELDNDDMRIIEVYGNDNIIFEKSDDIHFATVGSRIEKLLSKRFGKKIYVTTRSVNTIRNMILKFSD